ncbi:5-hydroxytryptamine receptor 2B-like [Sinocyclocheilus anshuiensis]|uniref:5-hydroxytryptamine receptor 2B-like n=1 Tax=Sinocyclocheilus anshuiensis TaxID=1608454 RepID=UPI0007BA716C|nr:PREDICTED: 5-hydroxytryptamine receptor 2B-like [Sinocyclocheilus anshuiensis]
MRSNFTIVWGQVNSAWQDTIEVAFVAASCLVLLVTLQVGFLANLFVAWAVHHQKSLQTSNNALLVNLAVIDILRCAIDCPLLLSVVLSARDLGVLFCSAQIASFSLICCVQLLTLACISAERYQAIAHPFKNAERRKRITVWIALTWLLPISISVICVIFAKDSPVYVRCRGLRIDKLGHDTFGVYILTPIWCVCLTVIIGFYGRIFLLVRAHGRKIFDKGSLPPPDKKKEDTKHKKEEKKTDIKNDAEKQQTFDSDHLKPNEKESREENPLDLHPTSEELTTTVGTDSLDINKPELATEISKETKVTFIDELSNEAPQVLEVLGEPNDHQPTSEENSSPLTNEEDGATESSTRQSTSEEGVVPNVQQDVAAESSQSSVKGEDGEEDPNGQLHNTLGTFPPSATEEDGTVESSTSQDTSPTSGNGDKGADKQSVPQETAAETSPASTGEATAAPQEEEVAGAICMMPSLAQRERGNAKKESKLAKRSGYIIFTFLIFWIPLIATVVLNHFFYQNDNLTVEVFRELEILTVSLVCMTSLTNPIIYAAVNPQFRTEFHNLKTKWKAFFTLS